MIKKNKRQVEWGIFFWMGMGVMNLIYALQLPSKAHPILYPWIMFGISMLFMIIAAFIFTITPGGKLVLTGMKGDRPFGGK